MTDQHAVASSRNLSDDHGRHMGCDVSGNTKSVMIRFMLVALGQPLVNPTKVTTRPPSGLNEK